MEHSTVRNMWKDYLATLNENETDTKRRYSSWYFCDNKEDADYLAELVVKDTKRATASLYLGYEYEKEEVPKAGDYCIITDWEGIAVCVIEVVKVDIVPYIEVTEEFAATEGEGDKSLEHWRKVHWEFFFREMKILGKEPEEDMLVVCEEFRKVFSR